MGYWTYYLLSFGLAYATQYPALAGLAAVFFLCRGFLPDPVVWLRTAARMRSLQAQTSANPANVTARRDLARIYLQRLRPGKAAALLEEALTRHPDDAEMLYLLGLAQLRARRPEQALDPLVRSVAKSPGVLFGQPYLVAADALIALRRFDEAEDALDRFLDYSGSSVERVRAQLGQADRARETLREGISTWQKVPGFKKREQLRWWLTAQVTRIWI
jgi:tetratricopeptide (TPR) repeat protein